MIFRLIDIFHARRDLAAAREDAAAAMRMYAQQCKRTKDAETLAAELGEEARSRFAEVQKLRGEVATHVAALDRCRQVSDGRAADLVEARRELERLRPKGADPITTPRSDADEVTRLTGELERTKRALSAAHDRLAEYRDREVVGDGRTG